MNDEDKWFYGLELDNIKVWYSFQFYSKGRERQYDNDLNRWGWWRPAETGTSGESGKCGC